MLDVLRGLRIQQTHRGGKISGSGAPPLSLALLFPCALATPALAADALRLRCDFPEQNGQKASYTRVVADDRGVTVTGYQKNKNTGEWEAQGDLAVSNVKDNFEASYYRKSSTTIEWGSSYTGSGKIAKFASTIDLQSGVEKNDHSVVNGGGEPKVWPTETGSCKPE